MKRAHKGHRKKKRRETQRGKTEKQEARRKKMQREKMRGPNVRIQGRAEWKLQDPIVRSQRCIKEGERNEEEDRRQTRALRVQERE
ncbi:hypothetical protein NDU88_006175 [Pleurodeles waltl]|uniref:Uncharacterized protein n=1 Tax=Pleurodeles waltl TaxID=8319 RepID=A0AAV7N1K4_PLEWA|nr:hypothetical protein NDU88_006175 [Pleurodeles waltl]